MTLQPTGQELKEHGFKRHPGNGTWLLEIEVIHAEGYTGVIDVWFFPYSNEWEAYGLDIFPTSWEQIDGLIELLTPKE